MVTDHLLSLGHRDIAYITTPLSNVTDARRSRMEGIRDRMRETGLEAHLQVLVDENENETAEAAYEFECGVRLTEKLLQQENKCTAIVAVNDMTAMGCISTLNQHGIRIPEEMAVCGFDNLVLHRMLHPQLTSVDQMAFHGCKVGLSILMEKMNSTVSGAEPVYMEYQPRLYVRGSTVKE
jgi:LacI family transcriptional regulator